MTSGQETEWVYSLSFARPLQLSPGPYLRGGGLRDQNHQNAHFKNFQHYFSISLQLQLSILLPY